MNKKGQAIVELVVALVVVLAIVGGLLQIGMMGRIHTDMMTEARQEAAENAVQPAMGESSDDYFGHWTTGEDDVNYSADDEFNSGSLSRFRSRIVDYAHPSDLHDLRGDNIVSMTAARPDLILSGLEHGSSERTIPILPVIRRLAYAADEIDVECNVWMVSDRGLW